MIPAWLLWVIVPLTSVMTIVTACFLAMCWEDDQYEKQKEERLKHYVDR